MDRGGHTICQDKFVLSHPVERFVNNELTSNEHIISLLWLYVLAQSAKLKELLMFWFLKRRSMKTALRRNIMHLLDLLCIVVTHPSPRGIVFLSCS